jgi:5-formaminoimidazole-4-carboxamide-1-(beta)-D-ribofuranosyl 5'-monophosphate synthetase
MAKTLPITIATIGSHSALDICRGAKDEGFTTLVIAERGREKTYTEYYKTNEDIGCVDEVLLVNKFSEILQPEILDQLKKRNVIFIPNRSFEVYINDYNAIENNFDVRMFGNRNLLRIEERGFKPNQYDLLNEANIRYPKQFYDSQKIDRLCIVKVLEKERGFERAFFLVNSPENYDDESKRMIKDGKITKDALKKSVIEEFVMGVQVNFNFFYSPLHKRLELLGTDTRRQTNLDGILRLTSNFQQQVMNNNSLELSYEEAGHIAVTVLESLLEQAFIMGERFVKASQKLTPPGIIGPFALQSIITPGPPKKDIVVIDVSPRVPGSPGIAATPYSKYLFGENISVGRRLAMEIKMAQEQKQLKKIIT